jgi:hypothetical protein
VNTDDVHLCRDYTVKRATRRWSLSLFYDLLNLALYNSFVLYVSTKSRDNNESKSDEINDGEADYIFAKRHLCKNRKKFLSTLADDLCRPWMKNRFMQSSLMGDSFPLRIDVAKVLGEREFNAWNAELNRRVRDEGKEVVHMHGRCHMCDVGHKNDCRIRCNI